MAAQDRLRREQVLEMREKIVIWEMANQAARKLRLGLRRLQTNQAEGLESADLELSQRARTHQ